jgi:hypothetical protein
MTNHDNKADDMAHDRFKADFNKLFGRKPQMRKAPPLPESGLRIEKLLAENQARRDDELRKVLNEADALRKQGRALIAEVAALREEVDRLAKRRDEAQRRAFVARPFALDADNPVHCEMIGDAIRANPSLLEKFKPN